LSRLSGKVAVITGAASGIGLAATRLFVKEGASVLAIDLDAGVLHQAVADLGPSVTAFVADVGNETQMQAAMAKAAEVYGGIDVVLPNAGTFGVQKPIVDAPIDNFERVMHVNVTGVLVTIKTGAPYIAQRGGGSIIITSSVGAIIGNPESVAYTASKHEDRGERGRPRGSHQGSGHASGGHLPQALRPAGRGRGTHALPGF
jgi:NAD(P)-dependent dehydrogenase (short-subunit alcohol dehydrogenase family)